MILRAWTTDSDGNLFQTGDEWNISVTSVEDATAQIASELTQTASDEFLHNALKMWFTEDKIENLYEGGTEKTKLYWNVTLDKE